MGEDLPASELVVLVGVQGSGKSTWVIGHLARTHAVVSKEHWPDGGSGRVHVLPDDSWVGAGAVR